MVTLSTRFSSRNSLIDNIFSNNYIYLKFLLSFINDLKNTNSSGYDNISSKKCVKAVISIPLTLIINQSLTTGIFPGNLKNVKIKPLFKKNNVHMFSNYRPISLLPVVSKIFEKVIHRQLIDYFTINKLFTDSHSDMTTFHTSVPQGYIVTLAININR